MEPLWFTSEMNEIYELQIKGLKSHTCHVTMIQSENLMIRKLLIASLRFSWTRA